MDASNFWMLQAAKISAAVVFGAAWEVAPTKGEPTSRSKTILNPVAGAPLADWDRGLTLATEAGLETLMMNTSVLPHAGSDPAAAAKTAKDRDCPTHVAFD